MWLINTRTLALEEFLDPTERYAILSHTWEAGEVSFDDFADLAKARTKPGFAKIAKTCMIAKSQGLKYAWVDTCCIDKRSSAELTEAINSMFKWYQNSQICYAYIADLPPLAASSTDPESWLSGNTTYRWFTRGWTLQELIAPTNISFYDKNWHKRGSKSSLSMKLSDKTGIDPWVLDDAKHLSNSPIARRMSWASHRQTTRVEDMAYCLLGIFNIHMPMIYGEGARAFIRLQEELAKETNDLSLFAWTREEPTNEFSGLLATSPSQFAHCRTVVRYIDHRTSPPKFAITNQGVQIEAHVFQDKFDVLNLDCVIETTNGEYQSVGIYLLWSTSGFVRFRPSHLLRYTDNYKTQSSESTMKMTSLTVIKRLNDSEYSEISKEISGHFYVRHQMLDQGLSLRVLTVFPERLWSPDQSYAITTQISWFGAGPDIDPRPFFASQVFDIEYDERPICRCVLVIGLSNGSKSKDRPYTALWSDQCPENDGFIESLLQDARQSRMDIIRLELKIRGFVDARYLDKSGDDTDMDWARLAQNSIRVVDHTGRRFIVDHDLRLADRQGNAVPGDRGIVTSPPPIGKRYPYVVTVSVRKDRTGRLVTAR
ncbi:beta transducin [Echria macrotheca]|uniref:Beta transducin n=1 Tax=Echria macrotheca TaxID=438768 RepID=A0AAJ0BJA7_9PEZI|nr:beta transducin [Echria macrotheca]